MQPNETIALIDAVVGTFGGVIAQIKNEIRELREIHGLPVLEAIPDGLDVREGSLATHRGGLWSFRNGSWICISNNVHDIAVEESGDTAKIKLHMSDGSVLENAITLPKATRKRPAVPAAIDY